MQENSICQENVKSKPQPKVDESQFFVSKNISLFHFSVEIYHHFRYCFLVTQFRREMDYLTEISRLLDGALKGDRGRVLDYAQILVKKLRSKGEEKAAKKLERIINQSGKLIGVQHVSPSVPVDSESRFPLADESFYGSNEVKVFFEARVKQRVDEFLSHVGNSDRLLAAGVGVEPTILLHGPPGTGKSLTAAYIASQLGIPLLTARVDTLVSSYLGSTSKNLRNLFEHASRRSCVLFLDEIDSIGKLRDDQHEMGELKRVVIALLQNIDRVQGEIVIIAATNHPHILDRAIWRRFQFHLEMEVPDENARQEIIVDRLRGQSVGISLKKMVLATRGMTGAEISNIIDDAIRHQIVTASEKLDQNYLLTRIAESRLGEQIGSDSKDPQQINRVRNLSPSVFTARRLGQIFNISPATVSRRLSLEQESS